MNTLNKLFIIAAIVIFSLWGLILGFANPFVCAFPDLDDLMRREVDFPTSSIAIDLGHPGFTQFEEMIANKIVQTELVFIRFNPERDFVGHVLPGLLRVFRYDGESWISVDETAAIAEVERPLDMAEYFAGEYSSMFRFAVTHMSATHACVIVEGQIKYGGSSYEFWQAFRPGFGLGAWIIVPVGRGGWTY